MTCVACLRFVNDPARIEALVPGLTAMGSARASVRGDDGICLEHDRIVNARDVCDRFTLAEPGSARGSDRRPGDAGQSGSAPTLTSSLPKF